MIRRIKRAATMFAALLLSQMLAGPALSEARLMVVSDTHYLAKSLYEGSAMFPRALRAGDGKLSQYGDELMDALAREAVRLKPDALVITGDLSFNGERASHEALAERLGKIEAAGIPVWVVPGNHDINSAMPVGYGDDRWYAVEGVDEADFSEIYADFMMAATEGANLSYLAPVTDELWLAVTDVSFYQGGAQTFGLFTAGHADWLEDAMHRAEAAGATLITATHHSLLTHTEFSRDSFLMFGNESMAALARAHGTRLNLSGHLHVQHIAEADGLADAALGALCVWPHRYALVTLGDDGSLTYEARSLGERALPEGFMEMSRQWLAGITREKTLAELAALELPEAEAEAMADYATRFNLAYFSGTYRSDDAAWREDPAYALWAGHPDSLMWQYMSLVMNEAGGDNLRYAAE